MKLLNADKINLYRDDIIELYDFDNGIKTIDDFVKQVEFRSKNLSKKLKEQNIADEQISDIVNTYKGDMFEIFAELFFNAFSNSPDVGIKNYTPVPLTEDYGIDAFGVNVNDDQVVIQMKYRSNPMELIDLASIARTYMSGKLQFNLPLEKNDTIFLLTTGAGITGPCARVCKQHLRVINRSVIAGKIDNNINFWKFVEDKLFETFTELENPK